MNEIPDENDIGNELCFDIHHVSNVPKSNLFANISSVQSRQPLVANRVNSTTTCRSFSNVNFAVNRFLSIFLVPIFFHSKGDIISKTPQNSMNKSIDRKQMAIGAYKTKSLLKRSSVTPNTLENRKQIVLHATNQSVSNRNTECDIDMDLTTAENKPSEFFPHINVCCSNATSLFLIPKLILFL